MAPRYAIIPGDFVDDPRPTFAHYRVILCLGRRTNRAGWCMVSQTKMAAALGITRQTVNSAIGDLVTWGYVERQGQAETHRAVCRYRVVMDRGDPDGPDTPDDGVVDHGDVSPTADRGVSPTADTRVGSRATPGVGSRATPSTTVYKRPPTHNDRSRQRATPGAGDIDRLLAQVVAHNPEREPIVRALLEPLVRQRRFDAPDPTFALGALADDPACRGLDGRACADVIARITTARTDTVRPSDIEVAVRLAAPEAEQRRGIAVAGARQAALASSDLRDLWGRTCGVLRHAVGDDVFDAWLADLIAVNYADGVLTVAAPTKHKRVHVERDHAASIVQAASAAGADVRSVCVVHIGAVAVRG